MMKLPRTLIAGGALILLTNAVVLAGVAYNRNDAPESSLRLTQRELELPRWRMEQDNSGIALALNWRAGSEEREQNAFGFAYSSGRMPAWLDKTKLAELGFDVSGPANTPEGGRYYDKMMAKEVLLVLELNGHAYQQELERARKYAEREAALLAANPDNKEFVEREKRAGEDLKKEEGENSRLFVIDAGLDLPRLRAAYPDRTRYAIVHGQVHLWLVREEKKETRIGGDISKLSVDRINVPAVYRRVFDASPKYEVNVAFGKRLEPWITDVSGSLAAK